MMACSFVTQRAVDDDEIGRPAGGNDLPGRGEADQNAATAGEQFFRNQDSERSADGAADDAGRLAGEAEFVEFGVIAGPGGTCGREASCAQMPDDVAVGVQD